MKNIPEDLPECMVFLLGKAYQKAHSDFNKRLKPYGLTNMQHLVLEALWYREGQTATELCKLLILDKATLSGVLERMVETEWIAKYPDPEDKRTQRLFPSKKANELKAHLIEERNKSNQEILSNFSPEEQVLFKRFLQDLI